MSDELYIGYLPEAPPGVAAAMRWTVAFLLLLAAGLGLLVAGLQAPFAPSVFEFGVVRELTGTVWEGVYPLLVLDRPGTPAPGAADTSGYLLVAPGKHGAGGEFLGLDLRRVRLSGSLIYRDGLTMVEVVPGSVEPVDGGAPTRALGNGDLGERTLVGEIVDSKCYLGVMKPGRGKPHRSCAARCISGGIPPVFVVESAAGERSHLLLVDEKGEAVNDRVLDWVAEPLEITGRVYRSGDLLVLAADPGGYRRVGGVR